jgi:hypothetical protein
VGSYGYIYIYIYIWVRFGKSTRCGEKDEEKRVNSRGGEKNRGREGGGVINHEIKIKKKLFKLNSAKLIEVLNGGKGKKW